MVLVHQVNVQGYKVLFFCIPKATLIANFIPGSGILSVTAIILVYGICVIVILGTIVSIIL